MGCSPQLHMHPQGKYFCKIPYQAYPVVPRNILCPGVEEITAYPSFHRIPFFPEERNINLGLGIQRSSGVTLTGLVCKVLLDRGAEWQRVLSVPFPAELLRTFNKLERTETLQEGGIVCSVPQLHPTRECILGIYSDLGHIPRHQL